MRIRSICIKEGFFERAIDFINETNLIHSKQNSSGKTTLIRAILYSLGYSIPNTKGIRFDKCDVICELELDNGEIIKLHRPNNFSIIIEEADKAFVLPEQQDDLHKYIFGTSNLDLLHNMLGAFYFDQEKGWTLLNRGVVIGSIHFNIDELIRGLSGLDCSELIARERRVNSELSKYRSIFSIAQYRDSVQQERLISDTYYDETNAKLQQLMINKKNIESEIARVGKSISGNRKFMDFVDEMKLLITTDDGKKMTVTKDNIVGLNDSLDYLVAKRKILMQKLSEVLKEIDKVELSLKRENSQLAFCESESIAEVFDKQIVKIPIDQGAIKEVIESLGKERKALQEEITRVSRSSDVVIKSLYTTIISYASELGLGDSETIAQNYLYTSNLRELSGAVLHKTVFAFKLGYIKAIESHIGLKLPIILDSPSGKEIDKENVSLMMNILRRDFADHQIIIASIYEYTFDIFKTIEIKDRLITDIGLGGAT